MFCGIEISETAKKILIHIYHLELIDFDLLYLKNKSSCKMSL